MANYILNTDFVISNDDKLPKGTYINPIDIYYVPKHILDDPRYKFFNPKLSVFCYTKYGILPIPKSYVEEA